MRGSTPRRTWRRAWNTSLAISPMVRMTARRMPAGWVKNAAYDCEGPSPFLPSFRPLMVSSDVAASPENRFEMLTPSSASSPRPLPTRASMIAASSGRFATRSRPISRSYQRNAGMPSLLPCSSPAWLTGVVDGTRAVHSVQVWLPERTHRLIVGMLPERISLSSNGAGTPSSWTNTTPGMSDVTSCTPRAPIRIACTVR